MHTEIEAKFTDVDADAVRGLLRGMGATCEHPEVLMRRKNYDYPDQRLDAINGWIRVRDEGNKVTLSYKQLHDRTLHGTKEVTVVVDGFETTCTFLESIGLVSDAYQETKREKWLYNRVEITIDTWPWIPSFIEIEGPSEDSVREVAAKLGFDWEHAMHGSVEAVYQLHYDVTEADVCHWPEITFVAVPEWLERKRKHQ